ncbi:MAG TPA: GNAT family N-acetyltransferase [Mycobacteriales bacterium]
MTLVLRGDGLVLREWTDADVPAMVRLFDEPSIDEWTPLEAPFDVDAATRYVARARALRAGGAGVQLAITTDGVTPLGEVLLFPREETAELGYAVGLDHRGARLATRGLRLLLAHAGEVHGSRRFVLRIAPGNVASQRVATACGFRLTGEPLVRRDLKGRRTELATWEYRA